MAKPFELLSHTADIKMRAFGNSQQELFINALNGMFSSIKPVGPHISYDHKAGNPHVSHYTTERHIVIHANQVDFLLVDFLSECLYLSDIYNESYFAARFTLLTTTELEGIVYGVAITGFQEVEIKAVTYHDLYLKQDSNGIWQATIVFDI